MLAELFAKIDPITWQLIGSFLALMLPLSVWEHLRKRWYEWRRDRRIARDPYILQDELAEFNWKIDDDLEPFEWREWLARYAGHSVAVAGGFVAIDIGYDLEWQGVLFALVALGFVFNTWRRINDPEETRKEVETASWDGTEPSPEAIYGIVGALVMAAFLLAFYLTFF